MSHCLQLKPDFRRKAYVFVSMQVNVYWGPT